MNAAVADYIENVITWPLPKGGATYHFELKVPREYVRADPGLGKSGFFWYLSYNRPLSFTWARDIDPRACHMADLPGGSKSVLFCKAPLANELLYRLELQPLHQARAAALIEYMTAKGWKSIELGERPKPDQPIKGVLVGRDAHDPGQYRATYFQEEIGPTGHIAEKSLLGAIDEVIPDYNVISPGLIDNIVSTVTSP